MVLVRLYNCLYALEKDFLFLLGIILPSILFTNYCQSIDNKLVKNVLSEICMSNKLTNFDSHPEMFQILSVIESALSEILQLRTQNRLTFSR